MDSRSLLRKPEPETTCTCSRFDTATYDPACPEHGDRTLAKEYRDAVVRGDFERADALRAKAVRR